jgi:lysophospholipase L1-like esterase
MVRGGCAYPHSYRGPQLAAAQQFLRMHHNDTVLVTLDIGANDVDDCAPNDRVDIWCGIRGLLGVRSGLNTILAALRDAAGPRTRIIGMNLYDPVLAWYIRPHDMALAVASVPLADQLNAVIDRLDSDYGVPTADVSKAFATNSFRPLVDYGGTQVPLNVARVLEWTNLPRRDVHPNDTGYRVMAGTFMALIG